VTDARVAEASGPAAEASGPAAEGWRQPAGAPRWLLVTLVSLAAWMVLTWPFTLHLHDSFWDASLKAAPYRPGTPERALFAGDHLQNLYIESVVVDNLRVLREPYLDLRSGAAGPAPLRTTSLDTPWVAVVGLLWPLLGLVAAYNVTLLLSSVATTLAAFGLLRRHTRWQLLATAGALTYAFSPRRMFHLSHHFNGVLWWAFPAALWAFEVALERHRAGRPWRLPVVALTAVVLTVALSGEYHHNLFLAGLLLFMAVWHWGAALLGRRTVPLGPVSAVVAVVGLAGVYVVLSFHHVFAGGQVAGKNGDWDEILLRSPTSVLSLVHKDYRLVDAVVYMGWGLVLLAAVGIVLVLLRRRAADLPYAVLALPLVVLTLGSSAELGPLHPYQLVFDYVPFVRLQRAPPNLMVVTMLVVVLLAVVALDELLARLRHPGGRRLAVAAVLAATLLQLSDYRPPRTVVHPSHADNPVIGMLRGPGSEEQAPFLGLPFSLPVKGGNSGTTYVAALTRRRTLNAYNQSPAPWLEARAARLVLLNRGVVRPEALAELRSTGTRQVLVVNMVGVPLRWERVVDDLVASGHFRLVGAKGPFALLELRE
jgi:hypothetical protein